MSEQTIVIKKKLWQCPICKAHFGSFEGLMKHTHTMREVGENLEVLVNPPASKKGLR